LCVIVKVPPDKSLPVRVMPFSVTVSVTPPIVLRVVAFTRPVPKLAETVAGAPFQATPFVSPIGSPVNVAVTEDGMSDMSVPIPIKPHIKTENPPPDWT